MAKIKWGETGKRLYETGVKDGVLYPRSAQGTYPLGVPWNGLTTVTESPSGAEATPLYADNNKYITLMSVEEFGATIEAYMYPDEFAACDGSLEVADGVLIGQQTRKAFGLAYKTVIGNDAVGNDYGYKIHVIYNALAAPSEKAYASINDSPDAITFSWDLTTTPELVNGHNPIASLIIDSTKIAPEKLVSLEEALFGKDGDAGTEVVPHLLLPDEIVTLVGPVVP